MRMIWPVLLAVSLGVTVFFSTVKAAGSDLHPVRDAGDLALLVDAAAGAKVVLLGESTHGTSEFYTMRAEISRQLIERGGISFVAVEGDWAAIKRVNAYVMGDPGSGTSAREILAGFTRWPVWMWANEEFAAFVEWLREWNAARACGARTALYGFDLYGWVESMDALEEYLREAAPDLAQAVRKLHGCLRPFADNPRLYGMAFYQLEAACTSCVERAAAKVSAHARAAEGPARRSAWAAKEHAFVVSGAERHFRGLYFGGAESWNARAEHMKHALLRRLEFHGEDARGIYWAHNTHVGDARATAMLSAGQRNIGQMARTGLGMESVFIVGLSTGEGEFLAAREWEGKRVIMRFPPAAVGSFDAFLEALGGEDSYFVFTRDAHGPEFSRTMNQRAAGVVFQPENIADHYVPSTAARRYDAILFLPSTTALRPLNPDSPAKNPKRGR